MLITESACFIIGCICSALIIVLIVHLRNNPVPQAESKPTVLPTREGFLLTSQQAYVSPETGAIKGPGIMTNGMTRTSLDTLVDSVSKTGFASDNTISLGVGSGDGFDTAYQSQQDIQAIDDRAVEGYQSIEDLDTISRKITSTTNNANNNMFTRAGSKPTKMIIEPNGIRGVIDEKYLNERDKNHQIATVQTVIPIQGYDVNIERLGEYLTDTHFSKISRNGKHIRTPTAAGAVGGGSKMNSQLEDNSETSSANKNAVESSVAISGNNVAIKDDKTGNTVLAPITDGSSDLPQVESFRQKYVRHNNVKL